MFWLAVLAIVILLCYKRRYLHDKSYDLGYNGPPVPHDNSAYSFDNKLVPAGSGKINSGASIHYSEVSTLPKRPRDEQPVRTTVTHAPVVLDSPEHSPRIQTKLQTYDESITTFSQEFETRSANLRFEDENPEWESMDIQLRIDPTGAQDPVITRKETKKGEFSLKC